MHMPAINPLKKPGPEDDDGAGRVDIDNNGTNEVQKPRRGAGGGTPSLKKMLFGGRGGGKKKNKNKKDNNATTPKITKTKIKDDVDDQDNTIPKPSDHTATETTMLQEEEEEVTETTVEGNHDDDLAVATQGKEVRKGNTTPTPTTTSKTKEEVKDKDRKVDAEEDPACYLVYEPDSSGRLVEHYSVTKVDGAIGRWTAGHGKKIAPFKLKRNAGRNVLIGSCSAGVQGRKNYCNGWCQFVKSAYVQNGSVTLWDPSEGNKGMPVDVYLYFDTEDSREQTVKVEQGGPPVSTTDKKLLAIACLPKNTSFFENFTVPLSKWLQDARDHGYSTKI
jgi:Immune Mapped Protein 2 (IMP2) N-terminal domain